MLSFCYLNDLLSIILFLVKLSQWLTAAYVYLILFIHTLFTYSLSLSLSVSLCLSICLSTMLRNKFIQTHFSSFPFSHTAQDFSHTQSLTLSHTHSLTLSHTHSRPLSLSLSPFSHALPFLSRLTGLAQEKLRCKISCLDIDLV